MSKFKHKNHFVRCDMSKVSYIGHIYKEHGSDMQSDKSRLSAVIIVDGIRTMISSDYYTNEDDPTIKQFKQTYQCIVNEWDKLHAPSETQQES